MADECVSWAEMRWIASQPDPVDAVMNGNNEGEDLLEVAAIVHDVRSAFTRVEPLERSQELAALTGVAPDAIAQPAAGMPYQHSSGADQTDTTPSGRKRSTMLSAVSGFVGTLTGKLVLGSAMAAASVGGLHASDVVEVPVLPNTNASADHPDPEVPPASDNADAASEGKQTADANKSAADAYTSAIQDWTDCVADTASAQGDEATRTTGGFDPREGCGDRPEPGDFGLNDLPAQAADAAQDARNEGTPTAGRGETPGGSPATTPDPPSAPENTRTGPPGTIPETPAADGPDGAGNTPSPGGSRP